MTYDIIIIGAGPAGLTASIYSGRAKMKTLVIADSIPGGQTMLTEAIENYPGFVKPVAGPELMNNMYEQAKTLEIEFVTAHVKQAEKQADGFLIKTGEQEYKALAVIVATGASYKKLGVKGEEEFTGRGVSYCGVCDAPFFKNKEIALVGGGDSAIYEAEHLLKFVSKLHLIHRRDKLRATKIMQDRVLNNEKTAVHWNSVVEEIKGAKLVESVAVRNIKTNAVEDIPCRGVFIFVGMMPNAEILPRSGFIVTDEKMKADVPGMFACGDIREKTLRQVSTAVGDGAVAAFSAQMYVEELKGIAYK